MKQTLGKVIKAEQEAKEAQGKEKSARKLAQEKEGEAVRRLVQMHVATGVRHMEDGDLFGALPWLAAALAEERDPQLLDMHRYRLGSILRATPQLVHLLSHGGEPVKHAEFSPDGRRVLTTSYDLQAKVWDTATGQQLLSPLSHDHLVRDGAFSPDSRRIATAAADSRVRLWDLATGLPLTPPLLHPQNDVGQLWFTPSGQHLVTRCQDATFRVWDVSSDDRSIQEWTALTQVLTGHRLDANDTVLALQGGELRKLWEIAHSHRPADFTHALQTTPLWHQRQAQAAQASGQWFAAAFHWGRLLAAQPDNARWYLQRGKARLRLGQHALAMKDLDQAVARGKDDPDVWSERAAIHAAQRQWEKAVADLSRAIARQDSRAFDWVARGRALAELERWEEAARDFSRAIELGPLPLTTYQAHAYCCLAAGKLDDFRTARTALLRRFLTGEDFQSAATIAHLYFFEAGAADHLDDLLPILQRATAQNSRICTYFHMLGPVTYRAGQAEEALQHLNEAVRLHGNGTGLPTDWLFLALVHQKQGHAEEAQRWLARATTYLDGPSAKSLCRLRRR